MGFALQASRCLRIPRDGSALPARVEVPRSLIKRAARRRSDGRFGRRQSAAAATTSTASGGGGGDTLDLDLPPRLSLSISEPCFSVSLTYDAGGGPLDGSSRVVARVGVAAWQWTQDVELVRSGGGSGLGGKDGKEGGDAAAEKPDSEKPPTTQKQQLWAGFVSVPASRLPAPGHLDLQAAFFAPRGAFGPESEERWDNAGGLNWGVAADVAPVSANSHPPLPGLARAPAPAESARAAASLLLRLDALAAARNRGSSSLLPVGSAPLLRALASAGDGPLLSAYERCRSWTDDAAVAAELARAAGLRVSNNSPRNSSGGSSNRPLHIVHVASEAAPFAKVGGLADVVSALARAHQAGGTHVELVLPKYDCGDYGSLSELRELGRISVPWGGGGSGDGSGNKKTRGVPTAVWGALCSGLPTYLLEPLEPLSTSSSSSTLPPPFWRGNAYGSPDDAERFLFFAIAALEFLLWAGRSPDVIHCHDWQSASVPLLLEAGGYRRKRGATFGGGLGFFGGSEGGGGGRGEGESLSSSPLGNGPLATTGTVLTIHNLAFPGRVNPSVLSPIVSGALPWDPSSPEAPRWVSDAVLDREGPRGLHGGPDALLLRAGVSLADATTTVSPTYSQEVLSDSHDASGGAGPGMKSALRDAASKARFSGVLNGIDVESYDPGSDAALFARFSVEISSSSSSGSSSPSSNSHPSFVHAPAVGKALCKRALFEELGLAPPPDTLDGRPAPLVAVVSRLTEQKGLDLIEAGIDAAAAAGAAVVVVGTASTPENARRFAEKAARSPPNVKFAFRFDEGLARRTYAAADLLLHPSLWEPCGLAQLVALRYGCVPLVRRTGGLACTCRDLDDWHAPLHSRNAFVFDGTRPEDAKVAVERAVRAYIAVVEEEGKEEKKGENESENESETAALARAFEEHWWSRELVPRCMRQEWSWARSAREYGELYRRVAGVRV